MFTKEKVEEIAENLDWSISWNEQDKRLFGKPVNHEKETYAEFQKYSPAGEDFSFVAFYTDMRNLVDEVATVSADFNMEEHVKMWLDAKEHGTGGVPDVFELVQDAKDIDKMLQDLAIALRNAEEGNDTLSKRTTVKYDIYVHLTGEVEVVGDIDDAKDSLKEGYLLSDVEDSLRLQELLKDVGEVQGISTDVNELTPGSLEVVK